MVGGPGRWGAAPGSWWVASAVRPAPLAAHAHRHGPLRPALAASASGQSPATQQKPGEGLGQRPRHGGWGRARLTRLPRPHPGAELHQRGAERGRPHGRALQRPHHSARGGGGGRRHQVRPRAAAGHGCPSDPLPTPCHMSVSLALPVQVLLLLQEEEEKSSAASQVTPGRGARPLLPQPPGAVRPPARPQPGRRLQGWPQLPACPLRAHFLPTRLWPKFLHPSLALPSESSN